VHCVLTQVLARRGFCAMKLGACLETDQHLIHRTFARDDDAVLPGKDLGVDTINPSAWILLAMHIALAEKRELDLDMLSGTIQAGILKEYQAQKEWIFPVAPSVRIVRDCIAYCAKNMNRYNPIKISDYHISEAGASPSLSVKRHSDPYNHHSLMCAACFGQRLETFGIAVCGMIPS
jgi:Methylmalonyl-CoA mutase